MKKPNIKLTAVQKSLKENEIMSSVGRELEKLYPDWQWYVDCKLESGVVSVRNISLDGEYGFYIPLTKLLNDTENRIIMQAGGEILERYFQDAGKRTDYDIKRDFTGSAIGDLN